MAAYAAVISLSHTIDGLLKLPLFFRGPSTRKLLEFAFDRTDYLQQFLHRLNDSSSSRDRMEAEIRDCAHKLEDVLQLHESNPRDEEVRQEITLFGERVMKMEKDHIEEEEEDAEEAGALSDTGLVVEMVGFETVQDLLISRMRPDDRYSLSFFAEHGSGRTLVARTVFEDLRGLFDYCAGSGSREVLLSVIAQVDDPPADVRELLVSAGDEILCRYLHLALENQRYMIVLDDVDDAELADRLITTSFPDQSNGSMVILTTRVKEVALLADEIVGYEEIPAYVEQKVWFVIREALFGARPVSPELEEAGKKIVENCGGRMISAAKAFLFLMKSDKTVEQWRKIAENKYHPSFILEDEISEISRIKMEMQDNRIVEMISPWIDFC